MYMVVASPDGQSTRYSRCCVPDAQISRQITSMLFVPLRIVYPPKLTSEGVSDFHGCATAMHLSRERLTVSPTGHTAQSVRVWRMWMVRRCHHSLLQIKYVSRG